jgi:hypothetical protein
MIASDALCELQALLDEGERLISSLYNIEPFRPDDALPLIERHLGLVRRGIAESSIPLALRGANLLATLNKGLSDLAGADRSEAVSSLAYNLTKAAIAASQRLRQMSPDAAIGER